jgi:hypothetical protein
MSSQLFKALYRNDTAMIIRRPQVYPAEDKKKSHPQNLLSTLQHMLKLFILVQHLTEPAG